jgi:hypothetical protein
MDIFPFDEKSRYQPFHIDIGNDHLRNYLYDAYPKRFVKIFPAGKYKNRQKQIANPKKKMHDDDLLVCKNTCSHCHEIKSNNWVRK